MKPPVEAIAPAVRRFLPRLRTRTRMLAWVCALMLPAFQIPVQAQSPHPVAGTWSWTLFGGKCQETFQFRPDGTLLTTSGDAVVEWTYTITPQASESNFYPVRMTLTRQNGKKDCYGDVGEEGLQIESFIQLSPAQDRFINCKAASLAACFGPLARMP